MGRTLVIGDIHGAYKALKEVINKAEVKEDDTLVFLGDYVDGWEDSYRTINLLIKLSSMFNCVFLQGNHDVWMREWLETGITPTLNDSGDNWENSKGGNTTVKSYKAAGDKVDYDAHRKFFRTLHHYYHDTENNRLFVHGGYTHPNGVKHEPYESDLWWDRTLFDKAYTHSKKYHIGSDDYYTHYPRLLNCYNEIYLGHSATLIWGETGVIKACNVWNVDTGCGHRDGRLSILDVDGKFAIQSSRLGDLYPNDPHNNYF
jgi:serine/threonine protein phosphatase 1